MKEGGTLKELLAADWSSEEHFLSQHVPRKRFGKFRDHSPPAKPVRGLSDPWVGRSKSAGSWGRVLGVGSALPVSYFVMYPSADVNGEVVRPLSRWAVRGRVT